MKITLSALVLAVSFALPPAPAVAQAPAASPDATSAATAAARAPRYGFQDMSDAVCRILTQDGPEDKSFEAASGLPYPLTFNRKNGTAYTLYMNKSCLSVGINLGLLGAVVGIVTPSSVAPQPVY